MITIKDIKLKSIQNIREDYPDNHKIGHMDILKIKYTIELRNHHFLNGCFDIEYEESLSIEFIKQKILFDIVLSMHDPVEYEKIVDSITH